MKKFDPIDVFFIAMISTYFIVLISIGITFLCITFSNNKLKIGTPKKLTKEKPKVKINVKNKNRKILISIKKWKDNIITIPLFRKLFMKEVAVNKNDMKVLEPKKLKIETKEKIEMPLKENKEKVANNVDKTKKLENDKTVKESKKKNTNNISKNSKANNNIKNNSKKSTSKNSNIKKEISNNKNSVNKKAVNSIQSKVNVTNKNSSKKSVVKKSNKVNTSTNTKSSANKNVNNKKNTSSKKGKVTKKRTNKK